MKVKKRSYSIVISLLADKVHHCGDRKRVSERCERLKTTQTDRQKDRRTDRQNHRQKDRQKDRQTETQSFNSGDVRITGINSRF